MCSRDSGLGVVNPRIHENREKSMEILFEVYGLDETARASSCHRRLSPFLFGLERDKPTVVAADMAKSTVAVD